MNILALNFSPKGNYSISLHFAKYVEAISSDTHMDTVNIGQSIHSYIRKPTKIGDLQEQIDSADIIMFVYPVYTFVMPYQMTKFIELVHEGGYAHLFEGKYFTQVLTSKHFFDTTAILLTEQYANDLGMRILPAYSGDMDDFGKKHGKDALHSYAQELALYTSNGYLGKSVISPPSVDHGNYRYESTGSTPTSTDHDIVIFTDAREQDTSLLSMIDKFIDSIGVQCRVLNIHDIQVSGGCLGCLQCTFMGECKYNDDMYDAIETVYSSHATIHAYRLSHHFTSSDIKRFDDRCFCHGHRTLEMYKPQGYLLTGSLASEPLCQQILLARADTGKRYLLDMVCDDEPDDIVSARIDQLAQQTLWSLANAPVRNQTFYGIGGMKVFRDLIYRMRYMMRDDHRFYRKNRLYDFPKSPPLFTLQMTLISLLMKYNKSAKMNKIVKDGMVMQYRKAIEKAKQDKIK